MQQAEHAELSADLKVLRTNVTKLVEDRPAVIADLTSIITEATRNAHNHSGGSQILVSGRIDRSFGVCNVIDDGSGFDPTYEPDGHFGLTGMRERADKIGAKISFQPTPGGGTTVTVEWGNR